MTRSDPDGKNSTMKKAQTQTGFTLTEMMITLVVAAILLSQAVPSFMTMLQDNRIVTQANDLVASLNMARSEAVKRGDRVTVCKSNDNATCTAAGGWQQGWIVFTDTNDDAVFNNTDIILGTHGPLDPPTNTLNGVVGNVANFISYNNSGFSRLVGGGGAQTGTLVLCDGRGFGASARAIVLNASGQIRTAPANDPTITATTC